MQLPVLSLVIPCVQDPASSSIYKSWFSAKDFSYYVQFVFLINSKQHPSRLRSYHQKQGDHEILQVVSDRYFGSCEENIQRVGDFIETLGDYILLVGEHDFVCWEELDHAVRFIEFENLGALAINIQACQLQADGTHTCISAIRVNDSDGKRSTTHQLLLGNNIVCSRLGYAALLNCLGPIDWAAFIGSHLYSREVFRRILRFKLSESVYSLVYKQLLFFSAADCRYGYFSGQPIRRLSSDFLRFEHNPDSHGWLKDHRTVRGLSPCFWVANLQHLIEVNDASLFILIVYSNCLSIMPAPSAGCQYFERLLIWHALQWCIAVVSHRLNGKSHYFSGMLISGDLGDLHTVQTFLSKLAEQISSNRTLYVLHGGSFFNQIKSAADIIREYSDNPAADVGMISAASIFLDKAWCSLDKQNLKRLNRYSFENYRRSGEKSTVSTFAIFLSRLRFLVWRSFHEVRLLCIKIALKARAIHFVNRIFDFG